MNDLQPDTENKYYEVGSHFTYKDLAKDSRYYSEHFQLIEEAIHNTKQKLS